jgi:hypothetical protein
MNHHSQNPRKHGHKSLNHLLSRIAPIIHNLQRHYANDPSSAR